MMVSKEVVRSSTNPSIILIIISVVIKKQVYDQLKHQHIDQASIDHSYHKSIEFIHSINHPYIVRLIGSDIK